MGRKEYKNAKNMNLKDGLSVKDDYIMRRVIGYSILSVLIVTLVFILLNIVDYINCMNIK